MQIVINIPNEKAERLIGQIKLDRNFRECKITELPKGHGRLIDADRLLRYELIDIYTDYGWESKISGLSVECAPTVIEADKEEE